MSDRLPPTPTLESGRLVVRPSTATMCPGPAHHGKGFMTEAAECVTAFAFVELGWPHLWLSNDTRNTASARIKEKQGATLADREPCRSVEDPGAREVWLLKREDWRARAA